MSDILHVDTRLLIAPMACTQYDIGLSCLLINDSYDSQNIYSWLFYSTTLVGLSPQKLLLKNSGYWSTETKVHMSLLISMRFVGQTHIGDQHILSSIDHCTILNVRHYFLKHLWHPVPNCCQIESKIHLILVSKIAIQIKTYDYDLIKLVPFSWTNEHRKSLGRIVCLAGTH